MRLKLVKRPGEATQVVDNDTDEQVVGVTSVQYRDDGVSGAVLSITVADFAVDILPDEEIVKIVHLQEQYDRDLKGKQ